MSGFYGVDSQAARGLAQALRSWQWQIDDLLGLIREAEFLSDVPSGVHLPLDQIARDGRSMSTAVDRAVEKMTSFVLDIEMFGSGLGALAAGAPGRSEDRWRAWLPDVTRQVHDDRDRAARIDALARAGAGPGGTALEREAAEAELRALLVERFADPTGVTASSAFGLIASGVPAQQVLSFFDDGHDAGLGDVTAAMSRGLTPAQARLHPLFFPVEYRRWHDEEARRFDLEAQIAAREQLRFLLDSDTFAHGTTLDDVAWGDLAWQHRHRGPIDPAAVRDELDRLILLFPAGTRERIALEQFVSGAAGSRWDRRRAADLFDAVLAAEVGDLTQEHAAAVGRRDKISLLTFDGTAQLAEDGSARVFDAIGATASTMAAFPSTFVGASLASSHDFFSLHELERGAQIIANDQGAALTFFATLGPEATALLAHERRNEGPVSGLLQRLSVALGDASTALPSNFADRLVRTRPAQAPIFGVTIVPERLFGHGEFAPAFLVAGAAASVDASGSSWVNRGDEDPRLSLLNRVVDAGLGADLVLQLHKAGAVDSLVWTSVALDDQRRDDQPPLVSLLLVQASSDDRASAALIDSAGSRFANLNIDVANGLSAVLGAQVPNYVNAGPGSDYFDAAQNIYEAGAGVDIEVGVRSHLLAAVATALEDPEPGWYTHNDFGSLAGHLDARKFVIFEHDAAARDSAIRNTNKWIGRITTAVGVSTGLGSLGASGRAGLGWFGLGSLGGTTRAGLGWLGLGSTGASFVGPMFLDDATHLEQFYKGERDQSLLVDTQGEALVLLAALTAQAFRFLDGGEAKVVTRDDGLTVAQVTNSDGKVTTIGLNNGTAWVEPLQQALSAAGAEIDIEPSDRRASTTSYANKVGDAVFSDPYLKALQQTTPRQR